MSVFSFMMVTAMISMSVHLSVWCFGSAMVVLSFIFSAVVVFGV